MSRVFVEDYIQKIVQLERCVGAKTSYKILEPFSLNTRDIVAIQKAAKRISQFIGLHDLIFIVAIGKQKEKVGGSVELRYGEKAVFVEISEEVANFEAAVLATLAHEIVHKYMHINVITPIHTGIEPLYQYENEVLTDIATVFLGLGKLMLKGCQCQNVRHQYGRGGIRTTTETLKVGYLDRTQLAFVYRLVCAMRGIPSTEYKRGLSTDSITALYEVQQRYGDYFQDRFHEQGIRTELVNILRSNILDAQFTLANIEKNLSYMQASFTDVVESFLAREHKKFASLLVESERMLGDSEYDQCLRFLNILQLNQKALHTISEIGGYSSKGSRYEDATTKVLSFIQAYGELFLEPSSDVFSVVICRNCGTRIRLPRDKSRLSVKCPKCHYQFAADTSAPVFKQSSIIKNILRSNKISASLFKRK